MVQQGQPETPRAAQRVLWKLTYAKRFHLHPMIRDDSFAMTRTYPPNRYTKWAIKLGYHRERVRKRTFNIG